MDKNAIGLFIVERRKQKGFTQKELAEKLQVTDKAVSRWETGKGLPDTSLLKPLSDVLGISVGELLSGKIIEETNMKDQTEKIILDTLRYSKQMLSKMISLILFLIGVILSLSPLFLVGKKYYLINLIIGILFIGAAFLRMYMKKANKTVKLTNKMKLTNRKFYISGIISLGIALILELLPIGAVLVFALGPNETKAETYSYFSLTPVGYAQFTPILAGFLTVAGIVSGTVSIMKYDTAVKLKNTAFICSFTAAILSLAPLVLFGSNYMAPASYIISAAIIISACFQAVANRNG